MDPEPSSSKKSIASRYDLNYSARFDTHHYKQPKLQKQEGRSHQDNIIATCEHLLENRTFANIPNLERETVSKELILKFYDIFMGLILENLRAGHPLIDIVQRTPKDASKHARPLNANLRHHFQYDIDFDTCQQMTKEMCIMLENIARDRDEIEYDECTRAQRTNPAMQILLAKMAAFMHPQ